MESWVLSLCYSDQVYDSFFFFIEQVVTGEEESPCVWELSYTRHCFTSSLPLRFQGCVNVELMYEGE